MLKLKPFNRFIPEFGESWWQIDVLGLIGEPIDPSFPGFSFSDILGDGVQMKRFTEFYDRRSK